MSARTNPRLYAPKNKTIWLLYKNGIFEEDFYQLKQLGNRGCYGITYQCKRKTNGQLYAVTNIDKNKFFRIPYKYRNRYLKAMSDELDILQTLAHPHIIQIDDIYENKRYLHIIAKECYGGTLFTHIAKRTKFTENDASKIIKQLLSALQYMKDENHIIHCNLTPQCILFQTTDENSSIKITDFGLSKVLPRLKHLTSLSNISYYLSPQMLKCEKYNHLCDMWSVGIILYIMIYGYPPFFVDSSHFGENEYTILRNKILDGFNPISKDRFKVKKRFSLYGPWFPKNVFRSVQVKDLIVKLLAYPVKQRYTVNEALQHGWIINKNYSDLIDVIPMLIRFNNGNTLKSKIVDLFQSQYDIMTPRDITEFGINKDNLLPNDDFMFIMNELSNGDKPDIFYNLCLSTMCIFNPQFIVCGYFKCLNISIVIPTDVQYVISKYFGILANDLFNKLVYDYLVSCDLRMYNVFRELDSDHDGFITKQQLKQSLKLNDPLNEYDRGIKIIDDMLMDTNGNIDYESFLLQLHPTIEGTLDWIPDILKQYTVYKPIKKPQNFQNKSSKKKKKIKVLPELLRKQNNSLVV